MARKKGNIDYIILLAVIFLVFIGFAALASASSDLGKERHNDAYFFLKQQLLNGFVAGAVGGALGYLIDYRKYKKWAPLFLLLGLAGLLLTFSPLGYSSGGARRWLQLGPVSVQPSELLKILLIVYLAAWLSGTRADRQRSMHEGFLPFLFISGVIGGLLILQRSTSAAVILLTGAFAVYFVGGARKKYLLTTIAVGLVAFLIIVIATPYRLERVKSFLNPQEGAEEESYQLNQALLSIGSGGLFGVGFGESTAKRFLPERIGDSIFAIIAEEFGFVGSLVVVLLFFLLVARIFILARNSRDGFARLLLVGFGTIIGIQAFIHIGANSGLIPLTGVPLPFISFGGTALAVFMTMSGIVLNISQKK